MVDYSIVPYDNINKTPESDSWGILTSRSELNWGCPAIIEHCGDHRKCGSSDNKQGELFSLDNTGGAGRAGGAESAMYYLIPGFAINMYSTVHKYIPSVPSRHMYPGTSSRHILCYMYCMQKNFKLFLFFYCLFFDVQVQVLFLPHVMGARSTWQAFKLFKTWLVIHSKVLL